MILGTGIDIVDIRRIEKALAKPRFKNYFTPDEQKLCDKRLKSAAAYAKRYAAKEACAKALGTGIGSGGFFKEIEVVSNERRAPFIALHGKALERLKAITPKGKKAVIYVALSDEHPYAIAQVIIEAL